MRHYAALGTLICCSAGHLVMASEPESPAAAATSKAVSISDSVVDASSWDAGKSLSAARGLFLQVDVGAAAAKIRESSKEFRLAARDAAADAGESLTDAADELEALSRRVEARTVKTIDELDRPFARALHAASRHHILQGQQKWRLRDRQQAGHRLRSAADSLEQAAAATGHRLSSDANRAIRESRTRVRQVDRRSGIRDRRSGQSVRVPGPSNR